MTAAICFCCHRSVADLNRHGYCVDCALCQHCDRRLAVRVANDGERQLGLCGPCNRQPGFRRLYRRKAYKANQEGVFEGWTPDREQQIRTLTRHHQIAQMREELCLTDASSAHS